MRQRQEIQEKARQILELARRHRRQTWAKALLASKDPLKTAQEILTLSEKEFQSRPKLEQVVWVAYKKHPTSLGSGCYALVVYRGLGFGVVRKAGAYGAVYEI